MVCDLRLSACAAGRYPAGDGTAADLLLRLCQILARRGAELGELAARHRLVHLLPCYPWLHLLWCELADLPTLALGGPARSRHGGRRWLGTAGELQFHHRTLSRRNDLAG